MFANIVAEDIGHPVNSKVMTGLLALCSSNRDRLVTVVLETEAGNTMCFLQGSAI